MPDWLKVRADFPVTKNLAYFLSAAMSPLPRPVFDEIVRRYERFMEYGDSEWEEDLRARQNLCARLGSLMGTDAANLTFVANTSTVMAMIAQSFLDRVPRAFHLVSLADEFPASIVAFEHLGIPMRYVEPVGGRYPVEHVLDRIDGETLAVVASQVQYATGFRLDVRRLGQELRNRGVLFIVNATQGFPFYPVDLAAAGVDALTASLHKWGFTGHVGALFFTSPAFRERFPCPWAGWLGIDTPDGSIHTGKNEPFHLYRSAAQFDLGTSNLQALPALDAALDYLDAIGLPAIRERLGELADRLISGLKEAGVTIVSPVERREERSPIVSITLGERSGEAVEELTRKGIAVSLRRGLVRIALNFFNDFADIDRLLKVLREIGPR